MLSKEIINQRLKDSNRTVELFGDYLGTCAKCLFKCNQGHTWEATPHSVVRGNDCPHCSQRFPLTKDVVNQRLLDNGREIVMIGEYKNNRSLTMFRCSHGHEWLASVSNVVTAKKGCAVCSRCKPLTKEIVNERLSQENRNIVLVGEYQNNTTKSMFRCLSCDFEWLAKPGNIVNNKRGCSNCADYGINLSIPTYAYILLFDDFIKYGITNNLERRLAEHRRSGEFNLIRSKLFSNGKEAQSWESSIKTIFGGNFINESKLKNGFTETLDPSLLNDVQYTL